MHLLERYRSLFSDMPSKMTPSPECTTDTARLAQLATGLDIIDRLKTSFKEGPCAVCGKQSNARCVRCKKQFFCGKAHQKEASLPFSAGDDVTF
jgi:hypothetical protein